GPGPRCAWPAIPGNIPALSSPATSANSSARSRSRARRSVRSSWTWKVSILVSDSSAIAGGDWHPAGSSRSVEARLVPRGGGLVAVSAADGAMLAPVAAGAGAISPRVGSIPRRVTFPDGSVFETWDNEGIDRHLAASGRGGAGIVHWLEQFRLRLI